MTKKIALIVLLVFIITAGAFAQSGTIRELTGEVELKPAGASAFRAAAAGDTVAANTIVSTGFRSTAVIAIGSSLITVRPLTRLSLSEIQTLENTENTSISLQTGRVRVEVNPPAGTRANLQVQTPSTTASVRGTSFEMDTENLTVITGRVIYAGASGPAAMVTAGNSSLLSSNGTAANPTEIAAASLAPSSPVGSAPPEIISQPAETAPSGGGMDVIVDYGRNKINRY